MLSIIVPVFNAHLFLKECIESVLCQDYSDFELILINDGSRDESWEICELYAKQDNRIVIINKSNEGVSRTRNLGLSLAKGEYILFLDADDLLLPGALKRVAEETKSNMDMVIYGFHSFGTGRAENDTELLKKYKGIIKQDELLNNLLSIGAKNRFRGLVWRIAFNRQLLERNSIRFEPKLKMSEDYLFVLQAIMSADKIGVIPEEYYKYRVSTSSVTGKFIPDIHDDMLYVNDWIRENVCEKYPQYRSGYECCCAETYLVVIQNCCKRQSPYSFAEKLKVLRNIRKQYHYSKPLFVACTQWRGLSLKRIFVFIALLLHMEALYIFLFQMKNCLKD